MDNKSDNNNERSPVATVIGGILLVIGLYFTLIVFTDTDGLNFLNYCLPALAFLILGMAVLFFSKPSKTDLTLPEKTNNASDEKEVNEKKS